jgi:hypothetical protein
MLKSYSTLQQFPFVWYIRKRFRQVGGVEGTSCEKPPRTPDSFAATSRVYQPEKTTAAKTETY